jgi:hypothetical protein
MFTMLLLEYVFVVYVFVIFIFPDESSVIHLRIPIEIQLNILNYFINILIKYVSRLKKIEILNILEDPLNNTHILQTLKKQSSAHFNSIKLST